MNRAFEACLALVREESIQTPSQWCEQNLTFNEAKNNGPFTFIGREFQREWVDMFGDRTISDGVIVTGEQVGKTGALQGGLAWSIANDPPACMWVMPSIKKGGETSSTRLIPLLKNSIGTKKLIEEAGRYSIKTMQYQIGGALIIFQGSNSPSNVSSTPCSMVIQDEMEKFDAKATGEAGTSRLADGRVSNCPTPKRFKTSTPAMSDGQIWEALMTTDLRRRFVPCPHCQKEIILVWSKVFTVFDLMGCEAFIQWDNEAKRPNRRGLEQWDMDRVKRSAAFICPFCQGRILDSHKISMDKNGRWKPTKTAAKGRVGWHLPSMYSSSAALSFGNLAEQFLTQKYSIEGCQNFINSKLAEPYNAQDTVGERVELVKKTISLFYESQPEKSYNKLMTVDCQFNAPYFWYVIRVWTPEETQCIDAGPANTWDELRAKQIQHKIPDAGVMVDSGFGAKSDAEVYRNCARYCQPAPRHDERNSAGYHVKKTPLLIGWMPSKGMPGGKNWSNKEGQKMPWTMKEVDPFIGTSDAGVVSISLFEYGADYMKDILDTMRKNKDFIKIKWSVAGDKGIDLQIYWKHMDAEHKVSSHKSRSQSWHWEPRSKSGGWPNHIFDCEVMQVALANSLNLIQFN